MKKSLLVILLCIAFNGIFSRLLAQQDSIRICALRVEFARDSNTLTTGDGGFMIDTTTSDSFAIDPAPHNKLYFEDQIRAAANYFKKVSGNRLRVSGRVFPDGDNDAYQTPHDMGYYNPNTTQDEINQGLSNLFVDAVTVADQSGDIDFSDFDLVVIFHAGVGKDVDVGYDTTPQDISSLYITKKFLQAALGESFHGVAVNNGAGFISRGIILPETENQEGYAIALTGMFVSNIGSHLGLYDLFSPSKQRSGIGRFGLMDAGLLNANGLIPSPPESFSRVMLGWDTPTVYTQPENNILLGRFGSDIKLPLSIRIPISNDEYYLLEYRGDRSVNIDSLYGVLAEDRSTAPTYLEVLKTYFPDQIEIGASGVLISVDDYDWGLPGAGVLIWHVDERIIAEKGADNKINDDPSMRGLDLEEADGAQDIGQSYTLMEPGYQTEFGTLADFWYANRPAYLKNFEQYKNEFSDSTAPNTRANLNHAVSHISIRNFSDNFGDYMTFNFERDVYEKGFPKKLNAAAQDKGQWVTTAGSIEGQVSEILFLYDQTGRLYAVGAGGRGLTDSSANLILKTPAAKSGQSLALADVDQNNLYDRLFLARDSSLYSVDLTTLPQLNFIRSFPAEIISPLVCHAALLNLSCANDSVYTLSLTGNLITRDHVQEKVADLAPGVLSLSSLQDELTYAAAFPAGTNQQQKALYFSASSNHFYFYDATLEATTLAFNSSAALTGQFAIADIDFNGVYEIIYNTAHGIFAVNQQGIPISNFPILPELGGTETIIGAPLILDADADGMLDFIVATSQGQLMAFNTEGKMLPGFPLATGDAIAATPVVMQLDDDEELELMAVTTTGTIYAWQLDIKEGDPLVLWTQENLDASNNALISKQLTYQPVSDELMPASRAYNYPNPNTENHTNIRYYLNESASVKIRIFDLAGTVVDEFSAPGNGGVDNEIRWDLGDIASGVYLCKVEAKSVNRSSDKIIKIMVIH